jgi:hypothetical protein
MLAGMCGLYRFVLAMALLVCPGMSFGQAAAGDSGSGTSAAGSGASAALPAGSFFDRLDRNKDGYLSRDELTSDEANNRNWIAVDRDRDGRISRSELTLISVPSSNTQPSAAAGETGSGASAARPPKQE